MNISPVQTDSLTGTTRLNRPTSERETFLNLLVTQLNNQDPMSPIQNEEFAAQLAQFSALEQLQQINATLSGSAGENQNVTRALGHLFASTLIGKTVEVGGDEQPLLRGRVDGVSFETGEPVLSIDGKSAHLGEIIRVFE